MKGPFKSVLLTLLATLVVLAGTESLARLTETFAGDFERARSVPTETWLKYSPTLGWERRPNFRGDIAGARREFDADGYDSVDAAKAAAAGGAKRVLFFGDSNTFGFGVDAGRAFPEQFERRVPGVASINLGVIGYSSYQGYAMVRKYVPLLKPDLIVVSFNFNDRRYVTRPEAADGPTSFERGHSADTAIGPIIHALEYVHMYRDLRSVLEFVGLLEQPDLHINVAGLVPRVDEEAYRRNLNGIAEFARNAGVPVVFLVLNDNPLQSDHLNRGLTALERHDEESAIAYLTSASTSHRMFANLARVYLAQALRAHGDHERAKSVLANGELYRSFSGGTVIRLDRAYNEIMRSVARETGATLVEAGAALATRPSVYFDYCHFNAEGHRIVAASLADRVASQLGLSVAADFGRPPS